MSGLTIHSTIIINGTQIAGLFVSMLAKNKVVFECENYGEKFTIKIYKYQQN